MIKNKVIVSILNPLAFVTSTSHEAYQLLEPGHFAGEELPTEYSTAMVVGKTFAMGDGLFYLLVTPENKQYIAPESAIEPVPAASKHELYEWFFNSFSKQVPDIEAQFTMQTGKNAPDLSPKEDLGSSMPMDTPTPADIEDHPGMAEPASEQDFLTDDAPIEPMHD